MSELLTPQKADSQMQVILDKAEQAFIKGDPDYFKQVVEALKLLSRGQAQTFIQIRDLEAQVRSLQSSGDFRIGLP